MRRAQGLPVNMIVLTALALLVLVVVGAFFISGFGQASSSVTIIEADQAQCQGVCQELASMAFNYDECLSYDSTGTTEIDKFSGGLGGTLKAREYACKCNNYGTCTVTLRNGESCGINQNVYDSLTYLVSGSAQPTTDPSWTSSDDDDLCGTWIE